MRLFVTKTLPIKKLTLSSISLIKNGDLKTWQKLLSDFQLTLKSYFKWFQLILAIPRPWKLAVLNDKRNCKNIIYLNHHLINNNQLLAIEKLIQKELYSLSIVLKNELPTPQKYFCNIFRNLQVESKKIYFLPRKVSNDTNLRMFQCKILKNILYLSNRFLSLINKILNCARTVNYKTKQLIAFFLNVNLLSNYGVI